jgi:hypothetical protein
MFNDVRSERRLGREKYIGVRELSEVGRRRSFNGEGASTSSG